jgi:Protein of unknown function (DUF2934)
MNPPSDFNPATGERQEAPIGHRPSQEEIALLAVHLWEEEGCPFGRDKANWAEAERRLLEEARGRQPALVAAVSAHERDRVA